MSPVFTGYTMAEIDAAIDSSTRQDGRSLIACPRCGRIGTVGCDRIGAYVIWGPRSKDSGHHERDYDFDRMSPSELTDPTIGCGFDDPK